MERLPRLLEALYAGIAEPAPWETFLRALAREIDAAFAVLILAAPGYRGPGTIVSPGADPHVSNLYAEGMFAHDPFVGLPEGEVVSFADFVNPATMADDFRTYLAEASSENILGVDLHEGAGFEARIRVTRAPDRADFGTLERALIAGLIPHLRIALRLFGRLQTDAAEEGIYRGTIERLALAALILDRHGRVVRTNAVADRLLAARDGIASIQGKLRITDRDAAAHLASLLAKPPAAGEAARLRISRLSGATELGAIARAVPMPEYLSESGGTLALFIADPEKATHTDPQALRDLFQFTRAEAALAVHLADGVALPDAARMLGMAHNTARSHLRAIFAKTGARRQSQLVHLLRTSVAGLAPPDPS